MKLTDRVRIPPEVLARQVGEETVILDLSRGTYYGLDPVGARIWQLLAEGRTLAEAGDAVAAEYEAPRETIERDLLALVGDLLKQRLIAPV